MHHYNTFKIQVIDVLSGDPVSGVIHASRLQHGEYLYSPSDVALFVIETIDSENNKKLLKSNYYLLEWRSERTRFCNLDDIVALKPRLKNYLTNSCSDVSYLRYQLKHDVISDILDEVEEELKNNFHDFDYLSGYFTDKDISVGEPSVGQSNDREFISDEAISDYESNHCSNSSNLEFEDPNPECQRKYPFEGYRFKMEKSFSNQFIELMQSKLANTGLDFRSLQMIFKTSEENGKAIVDWYYKAF